MTREKNSGKKTEKADLPGAVTRHSGRIAFLAFLVIFAGGLALSGVEGFFFSAPEAQAGFKI